MELFGLFVSDTSFLVNGKGECLIWIPARLCGKHIAISPSNWTVAIGGASGAVTIIRGLKRLSQI